ncbi:MAG TPA: S9 family peptidase, partial [Thermoanaerobaculia bacterium]
SHPAWSPDGKTLAFLSDALAMEAATAGQEPDSAGQLQLYLATPGGAPRKVTDLKGHLADPKWSPDGKTIALLFVANQTAPTGALAAYQRDAGVVGETPAEQQLITVDLSTGAVKTVTPDDLFLYEYDWSPDGKHFVATAAHGSGENNWWVAQLVTVDAAGGPVRTLLAPRYQVAEPRWSPDGSTIAFIGGLMSDFGLTGGDVYTIPAAGGAAKDVTPGIASSPSWIAWTGAGRIAFSEVVDGEAGISSLDVASGRVTSLWRAPVRLELALSKDGRTAAGIVQSFAKAEEVWAGPVAAMTQVTHRHAALAAPWGETKSLHWQSDGQTVQGWLHAPTAQSHPPDSAGAKHPMIVIVHGGPAGASGPSWSSLAGVLTSQGYYVFFPNPRGSYGQGEAFTQGNVKDFGYGDLRDILSGVEAAVREAPIDTKRVGLFGWSYGGYMAMWTVTQTDRFRAVVAGAGIVNWQSYYGQNRIDQWMIPYFGASVYDDPWIYARSSPISFIKNVKTPTLVLQGERDSEVPAPQAYEFWHALKTLGVETQLVIYPDQGHHLRPADDRDRAHRLLGWFGNYLK